MHITYNAVQTTDTVLVTASPAERCDFTLRQNDNSHNNYQLLDEVEQNIVICQWRADQLFADAEGRGK